MDVPRWAGTPESVGVPTDGNATSPKSTCDATKSEGQILFFNFEKGYGFICPSLTSNSDSSNMFFHIKALKMVIEKGDRVTFLRRHISKGMEAIDVTHAIKHVPLVSGSSPFQKWRDAQKLT
eukprot:gnl/MRDRNA2_/MRDRNA2_32670_c0_seq1.p1 gnl/MRDRNA2_/MRDRNA2_32670_c0~~gnl/MRDRNA2_/MRDRNA2_32670_c0_seq1.p1  ORF type:complete len:137 (+),score=12.67 gnl/MRDRNA2_/MRDRNA2_32670_c0_seq1:48-413(+)